MIQQFNIFKTLFMNLSNLKDFYSIRITYQWQIIFRWKNGSASEVEIIDYN